MIVEHDGRDLRPARVSPQVLLVVGLALAACASSGIEEDNGMDYVRVEGGRFVLRGEAYQTMGANFWAAPYVDLDRLRVELDTLQGHGVKNLRILALSEGDIPASQRDDPRFGPQRITPASSDHACADPMLMTSIHRLEKVLDEIQRRGMTAVLILNNWYHWSGGMPQYVKWAYEQPGARCEERHVQYVAAGVHDPATGESLLAEDHHVPFTGSSRFASGTGARGDCQAAPLAGFVIPHPNTLDAGTPAWKQAWADQQDLSTLFLCNEGAQAFFFSRAEPLIRQLKDHPGIMAWQLANEPRSFKGWSAIFRRWVERTARFIKDIDPNHLVSIGSEGELTQWGDYANSDYRALHELPDVDYLTFHVWPENWGWFDPRLPIDARGAGSLEEAIQRTHDFIDRHVAHARALHKPAVVEEFGLARDNKLGPASSSVHERNRYYAEIFARVEESPELGGVNFWAWSGTGMPAGDGNPFWRVGSEYLGDPPHEPQGWYSVYATDTATLRVIADHAARINTTP